MYRNILLPQLKRAPWRTMLFFVLLAIATAFFCLSVNLYLNGRNNIAFADDAFSTVAYLEFYRDLDGYGNHTTQFSDNYVGRFITTVDDLNFDILQSFPFVQFIDWRKQLAAYVPGTVNRSLLDEMSDDNNQTWHSCFPHDLIRFRVNADTPVVLSVGKTQEVPMTIYSHANSALEYQKNSYPVSFLSMNIAGFQENLKAFNQAEDADDILILKPDVEYLASVSVSMSRLDSSGKARVTSFSFEHDHYGTEYCPRYWTDSNDPYSWFYGAEDQPFWIWEWETVQNDSALQLYFEDVAQAYNYSLNSFAVMTTEDMGGIPGFYQGNLFIQEGRTLTEEDHADHRRVCIISRELSEHQGWSIGDTIELNFYAYDGFWEGTQYGHPFFQGHMPLYMQGNGGFIDRADYTIVGIWSEKPNKIQVSLDIGTESLLFNTILVPTSSVQNLDTVDAPASGSRLTVHLENGRMEEFLEAASKVTLSESADEVRITAFDQGYSQAQDSLQSMLGTAQFLLALASTLLVVAGVLLAFFYTQSQKQNMALMRLLGCNRRQAGTMSMLGCLLILLPGGLLGAGAGHLLTDRVANAILNSTSALDKPEYAGFREIFGVQAEVEFALAAQPAVSAAALAIAAGLFLVGCLFFTLLLLRKEPREALQDK